MSILAPLGAQKAHRALRSGDKAYEEMRYDEAQRAYQRSLEADNSARGNYNLGNSLYEQGDYEGAAKRFEEAAGLAETATVRERAYRNLGDAYYQQGDYEKSLEAYKESLRLDPNDPATKHNLSMALREIRRQQEQQEQQQRQNQDQNQDQNDPQPDQPDANGDSDQQGEGSSDQNDQNAQEGQGENADGQEQSPRPGQPSRSDPSQTPRMSRAEAERQLDIAAEAEKATMRRRQGQNQSSCTSKKEW